MRGRILVARALPKSVPLMRTKEANKLRMQETRDRLHDADCLADGPGWRGGRTKAQYAEWLQGFNWDYFMTATFRKPRVEPYYALKAVFGELENYGVARAFLGAEPFQSGDLHIHGILAGPAPDWRPGISLPWDIWNGLFVKFGRAKVEACNNLESVTAYCAKYVLKQQSRVCDYYAIHGLKVHWDGGRLN